MSSDTACESVRHHDVPARHVIQLTGVPDQGYRVCDICLLAYVTKTYLRAEYLGHLPFQVRPL